MWADKLPAMIAAREARQAMDGPRLRALDEQRRDDRERATRVVSDALNAVKANTDDRALVARITGLALSPSARDPR